VGFKTAKTSFLADRNSKLGDLNKSAFSANEFNTSIKLDATNVGDDSDSDKDNMI